MSDLVHRVQRLHAYEHDAGGSVLASLDSIPHSKRPTPESQRAFNTAAHIQAARLIWLARLTGTPGPTEVFFEHAEIGDVERMTAEADTGWDRYANNLADAEIARVAHYANMRGEAHHCPVADIVTHVFNHGSYHRGQIAMLVAQAGGEPAVTDFIFYAYREPDQS